MAVQFKACGIHHAAKDASISHAGLCHAAETLLQAALHGPAPDMKAYCAWPCMLWATPAAMSEGYYIIKDTDFDMYSTCVENCSKTHTWKKSGPERALDEFPRSRLQEYQTCGLNGASGWQCNFRHYYATPRSPDGALSTHSLMAYQWVGPGDVAVMDYICVHVSDVVRDPVTNKIVAKKRQDVELRNAVPTVKVCPPSTAIGSSSAASSVTGSLSTVSVAGPASAGGSGASSTYAVQNVLTEPSAPNAGSAATKGKTTASKDTTTLSPLSMSVLTSAASMSDISAAVSRSTQWDSPRDDSPRDVHTPAPVPGLASPLRKRNGTDGRPKSALAKGRRMCGQSAAESCVADDIPDDDDAGADRAAFAPAAGTASPPPTVRRPGSAKGRPRNKSDGPGLLSAGSWSGPLDGAASAGATSVVPVAAGRPRSGKATKPAAARNGGASAKTSAASASSGAGSGRRSRRGAATPASASASASAGAGALASRLSEGSASGIWQHGKEDADAEMHEEIERAASASSQRSTGRSGTPSDAVDEDDDDLDAFLKRAAETVQDTGATAAAAAVAEAHNDLRTPYTTSNMYRSNRAAGTPNFSAAASLMASPHSTRGPSRMGKSTPFLSDGIDDDDEREDALALSGELTNSGLSIYGGGSAGSRGTFHGLPPTPSGLESPSVNAVIAGMGRSLGLGQDSQRSIGPVALDSSFNAVAQHMFAPVPGFGPPATVGPTLMRPTGGAFRSTGHGHFGHNVMSSGMALPDATAAAPVPGLGLYPAPRVPSFGSPGQVLPVPNVLGMELGMGLGMGMGSQPGTLADPSSSIGDGSSQAGLNDSFTLPGLGGDQPFDGARPVAQRQSLLPSSSAWAAPAPAGHARPLPLPLGGLDFTLLGGSSHEGTPTHGSLLAGGLPRPAPTRTFGNLVGGSGMPIPGLPRQPSFPVEVPRRLSIEAPGLGSGFGPVGLPLLPLPAVAALAGGSTGLTGRLERTGFGLGDSYEPNINQ